MAIAIEPKFDMIRRLRVADYLTLSNGTFIFHSRAHHYIMFHLANSIGVAFCGG